MKYKFPLHVKRIGILVNEKLYVKRELDASAKSIHPSQPAKSS